MRADERYTRMNTAHDLLVPCPACGKNRDADPGHKICLVCEGYADPYSNAEEGD